MKKLMYLLLVTSCISVLYADQPTPSPMMFEVGIYVCDTMPSKVSAPVCINDEMCDLVMCVDPMLADNCAKVQCLICKDECVRSECTCIMEFDSCTPTTMDNGDCMFMVRLCKSRDCSVEVCKTSKNPGECCGMVCMTPTKAGRKAKSH